MNVAPNMKMNFERVEELIRYVTRYQDDYGNEWTLELLGTEDAVLPIAKEPRVILNAVPEGESAYGELNKKALSQTDERSLDFSPEQLPPDANLGFDLQVRISLDYLASPEQNFVVYIHFDPPIFARKHLWTFEFGQRLRHFNVGINNVSGEVGQSSWLIDNGYVGQAKVWRTVDGGPTKYEIESHIGVYRDI